LELGYWTFGIGLGYTLGLGGGLSGSVTPIVDTKGGIGIIASGGGGGYAGIGAGGSVILQATDADSIRDLEGPVVQTGGSGIIGPDIGIQGGVEWLVQKGPSRTINGANLFAGPAGNVPVPFETHSLLEYGHILWAAQLLPVLEGK
jgi:hypothetical protein